MKIFAERLKELRTENNLSQAKLAVVLKTHQQTVDRWERGLIEPDMSTLIQLSMFFDVSVDYLLGLSNDITKK